MELGEILEGIKKRWTASERYELIIELDEAPRGASTGGEGMDLIGGFLLGIKRSNLDAFNEVKDFVDEYAKTCAEHGFRFNQF